MHGKLGFAGILVLAAFVWLPACSEPQPRPEQAAPASQPAAQPSEPEQAQEAEAEAEPETRTSQPSSEAAAEPIASGEGDASAGKVVYGKKCTTCHGQQGEGKEAIAKMLKVELRPLGSQAVQAKTDDKLHKDITQGTGKMKPVKGLSDADLASLVAFIRTLK
jgi:mono/diheme cytochrome c family protein